MADDGKLRKAVARGTQAKHLLANPLLQEAFEAIESEVIQSWKTSVGNEKEQRENAYFLFRALEDLKAKINRIVREGNDAQTELKHKEGQ